MKLKKGKGFSFAELKAVNVKPSYAKTVGISVDPRRKNRTEEEFQRNVEILKDYMKNLVILPRDPKKQINGMTLKQLIEKVPQTSQKSKAVQEITDKVEFREVTEKDIKKRLPTKTILNERKKRQKTSYDIQSAKKKANKAKKSKK